ncbi:MAG: U32 family peptidase [Erysipelotrichia bacterium]|nr:U32 family peptidase [Erysipelotrichia bacterium]
MSSCKKIELLAPAGDLKRCRTAVDYGADAVYLGGHNYSLRSRAGNFSIDEIAEACAYARAHQAVIHVTVNVIPHEEDFEGLKEYLKTLQDIGVHAVIEASPAIMALTRAEAPKLEIHCSTQMSVTNAYAAKFLSDSLGIDRVVLARECTMAEVKEIAAGSPVDTEAFIHGGMCVNLSGRCTLSNRMTLRDANRGGCAQSCRWMYRLYQNENEISDPQHLFTMGSKDLCAADTIAGLISAGVSSLKIEGRMKTEYYVASIVSAYRHLIDEIYDAHGPLSDERMAYHRMEIMKGENREVCSGFYQGIAGSESIIHHPNSDADVNHGFLATVKEMNETAHTAVIETRNPFNLNDEIEVLSPGRENLVFKLQMIQNEQSEYIETSRVPMRRLCINAPVSLRPGDILRKGNSR